MLRLQHMWEHTTTKAMNASAASRTLLHGDARVNHPLLQRRPAIVAQVKPAHSDARLATCRDANPACRSTGHGNRICGNCRKEAGKERPYRVLIGVRSGARVSKLKDRFEALEVLGISPAHGSGHEGTGGS